MKRQELLGVDVSRHNSPRLNNKTPVKIFIMRQTDREVQQTDLKFYSGCLIRF